MDSWICRNSTLDMYVIVAPITIVILYNLPS